MQPLQRALETIATALETPQPLHAMIAQLEADLSHQFHPARVTISLNDESRAASSSGVPLRIDGTTVGMLHVAFERGSFDSSMEDVLRLIAAPMAAAIAYRRLPQRRSNDGPAANIDALCRIPNRRGFDEHLQAAWERAATRDAPLIVAVADVDYFKAYNDRYGHIAGDRCLQAIAALLVKRREGDHGFAARYGGEEFVLVFEQLNVDHAVREMQLIFDRLAALNIEHAGTTLGRVSMSVGIAAAAPTLERATDKLIDEADRALYQAKRLGRNRICAGSFVSTGPIVAKLRNRRVAFAAENAPTFGRADDLARILSALRHARMLTLVGPPGIGKSRLLALVADEATTRLHRPVVFVEPELLRVEVDPVIALASACELTLDTRSVLETVTDALDDREAIVLLDDIDPSRTDIRDLCSHLCASAPRASIVAAAQTPMGIPTERTIVVPPLGDEAALQLLSFHGADAGMVGREIVRQLGGNPASIAATAGWIAELGIAAVARRFAAHAGALSDPEQLAALFAAN
jgi:diguanylate cyclase (GGDEF)-like protein